MREVRHAKRVSVIAGGAIVLAASLGLWRTAVLAGEQEGGMVAALTAAFASLAFFRGCLILSWNARAARTVLMRAQPADAVAVFLPVGMLATTILGHPELRDPGSSPIWALALLLGSTVLSVQPAETALLSEVPRLGSVSFLDWLRSMDFGFVTLVAAILSLAIYFLAPLRNDALTWLITVLTLAYASLSIWRIVEKYQVSKAGPRLSQMQIIWLRAIHVNQGHEAAIKELRSINPKMGTTQAERVVENLYRAENER